MVELPRIGVPVELQNAMIEAYVPHWHACVLGPIPLGEPGRLRLSIGQAVCPTRGEMEAVCMEHAFRICEGSGYPFDSSEWDIQHIFLLNGN